MAAFLNTTVLNRVIKLGAAAIITGAVVNSTLYNGETLLQEIKRMSNTLSV